MTQTEITQEIRFMKARITILEDIKYCYYCKQDLPRELFNLNTARYDGLCTECRFCQVKKQ